MINPLNLRRLQYFVVVAEELHFGRAAEQLHMAQPPLSQQIQLLESELGVKLFQRTTRRVELTEAGVLLLPQARRLLVNATDIHRMMNEINDGGRGTLRVGFVDSAAYDLLPRFINSYKEAWPLFEFSLESLSSDEQLRALENGHIDIGICRTIRDRSQIYSIQLMKERLMVATHVGHPFKTRDSIGLSELRDERMVGFDRVVSQTLHAELSALMANHGVDYEPVIEATEYSTILGLVASGEGIALVPAGVATLRPPGLKYVALKEDEAWVPLILMARKEDNRSVVSKSFRIAEALTAQR